MILPFRRIAIFDPNLVLGNPFPIPQQAQGHIFRWVSSAQRRGADALYFRVQGHGQELVQQWFEVLLAHPVVARLTLLLPAGLDGPADGPAKIFARHYTHNLPPAAEITGSASWKGRSCHSLEDIQQAIADGMDYAFLSPVFSTETHPEAPALGLEAFGKICQQFPEFPIFALGGITPDRERHCLAHGAFGIAAIRYFS